MSETKENRNTVSKKNSVKILLVCVGILLLFCVLSAVYRRSRLFKYEDHLNDVVLSVDQRDVTLREFGYYIFSLEDYVNRQAITYDHSNPHNYWNIRFRAGLDSQFLSLMAKDKAYEVCICDMIYEKMALDAGYSLNGEEEQKALEKANEIYREMSKEQRKMLGINQELVEDIQKKKVLIAKFAKDYVKEINFEGYHGYREELVSAGGAYYEEHILPEHKVVVDEDIKEALTFGRITINKESNGK